MSAFGQSSSTSTDHQVPLPADAGGLTSLNFSTANHLCASDWDGEWIMLQIV